MSSVLCFAPREWQSLGHSAKIETLVATAFCRLIEQERTWRKKKKQGGWGEEKVEQENKRQFDQTREMEKERERENERKGKKKTTEAKNRQRIQYSRSFVFLQPTCLSVYLHECPSLPWMWSVSLVFTVILVRVSCASAWLHGCLCGSFVRIVFISQCSWPYLCYAPLPSPPIPSHPFSSLVFLSSIPSFAHFSVSCIPPLFLWCSKQNTKHKSAQQRPHSRHSWSHASLQVWKAVHAPSRCCVPQLNSAPTCKSCQRWKLSSVLACSLSFSSTTNQCYVFSDWKKKKAKSVDWVRNIKTKWAEGTKPSVHIRHIRMSFVLVLCTPSLCLGRCGWAWAACSRVCVCWLNIFHFQWWAWGAWEHGGKGKDGEGVCSVLFFSAPELFFFFDSTRLATNLMLHPYLMTNNRTLPKSPTAPNAGAALGGAGTTNMSARGPAHTFGVPCSNGAW